MKVSLLLILSTSTLPLLFAKEEQIEEQLQPKLRGSVPDRTTIMENELSWVEHEMELYRRKRKKLPLRSPIQAKHINSEDWRSESLEILFSQDS